jgi:hypothetical protein
MRATQGITFTTPHASRTNLCSLCFRFERLAELPAAALAADAETVGGRNVEAMEISHLRPFRLRAER